MPLNRSSDQVGCVHVLIHIRFEYGSNTLPNRSMLFIEHSGADVGAFLCQERPGHLQLRSNIKTLSAPVAPPRNAAEACQKQIFFSSFRFSIRPAHRSDQGTAKIFALGSSASSIANQYRRVNGLFLLSHFKIECLAAYRPASDPDSICVLASRL